MTWRSAISSEVVLLLCSCWGFATAATVTGQVILAADPEQHGVPPEASSTVVWLMPTEAQVLTRGATHARMVQKNKHFEPHILPIQVGTSVDFPNLDPIFHNAFSNFNGQLFDIGLYPPASSRSILFRREGLVRVFCNNHPAMSAVIVVVATPFFAVTDHNGHYAINNVPTGAYTLYFFQERAVPENLDVLTRAVSIVEPATDLGEVRISKAGYIPMPHKNKYGREYPLDKATVYH